MWNVMVTLKQGKFRQHFWESTAKVNTYRKISTASWKIYSRECTVQNVQSSSSLSVKPKWRVKNHHMALCRASRLEAPNWPLLKSLFSSSSVDERVAFGLLPLPAFRIKLFRLTARSLRDISNSFCTRIFNGDFPSERNLWMLRWKPDSVSGPYSSPLILRKSLKNVASKVSKWSRSSAGRSKTSTSPLFIDPNSVEMVSCRWLFSLLCFHFLLLHESFNFFLTVPFVFSMANSFCQITVVLKL